MTHPDGNVDVEARPFPLTIDPRTTAVIVVDMQQGFVGPGGWWDRRGVDVSGAQAAIAPIARVLNAARHADIRVVYLTMDLEHADERSSKSVRMAYYFAHTGRRATQPGSPSEPPAPREVRPLTESDIMPELAPEPGDMRVVKTAHSGFYETNLHAILQEAGVTTLVFTGCTTSICVESTLRDAYFREYECLLLSDCTAEPVGSQLPRTNHEATLHLVELVYGSVTDSKALIQALTEHPGIPATMASPAGPSASEDLPAAQRAADATFQGKDDARQPLAIVEAWASTVRLGWLGGSHSAMTAHNSSLTRGLLMPPGYHRYC